MVGRCPSYLKLLIMYVVRSCSWSVNRMVVEWMVVRASWGVRRRRAASRLLRNPKSHWHTSRAAGSGRHRGRECACAMTSGRWVSVRTQPSTTPAFIDQFCAAHRGRNGRIHCWLRERRRRDWRREEEVAPADSHGRQFDDGECCSLCAEGGWDRLDCFVVKCTTIRADWFS